MDVEESRVKRLEKQQSRYRDRGGIFVPAETNPLLEVLLTRGPNGESPSKPSQKRRARSHSRSPVRQGTLASGSRTIVDDQPNVKSRRKNTTAKPTAATPKTGRKSAAAPSARRPQSTSEPGPSNPEFAQGDGGKPVKPVKNKTPVARGKATRKTQPKRRGKPLEDEQPEPDDPPEIAPVNEKGKAARTKRSRKPVDADGPELDDVAPPPKRARTKATTASKPVKTRKNGKVGTSEPAVSEQDPIREDRLTKLKVTEPRQKRAKGIINDDDDVEGDDVAPVTQNPIPSKYRTSTRSQLPPDKPVTVAKASSTRKTTAQSNPKEKPKAPVSNPAILSSNEDEHLAPIRKAGPSITQSSNKDRSDNQRSAGTKNQKPKDVLNSDQESSDSDTPLALAVVDKPRSTSRSTTKKPPPRPISNMPDTVEGSSKPSKRVRQDRKNVTEEHGQSEPSGRGGKKRAETTVDVLSGVNDADDRDVEQVESAPKKVARKGKEISSRSKDKTKAEKKLFNSSSRSHKENRNAQKPVSKGRVPMPKPRLSMFPMPNMVPDDEDDPLDLIG